MTTAAPGERAAAGTPWPWMLLLALPVIGLLLLLVRPELDMHWEHHPSHFWLVLLTAAGSVALAYVTNVVATRQRDARLVLVSLAFLASAGFLGLHALATPGVLLDTPNAGFVLATPVGLFIASFFAAASVTALGGPRAVVVLRLRPVLLGFIVGLLLTWAFVSLASLPPLNGPLPATEASGPLALLAIAGVGLYGFAAFRCFRFYLERGGVLVLAVAVAMVLLGEAMLAIAISRNWQLSWWSWHVLMLVSFLAIALGTRAEYRRSGSLTGAFGGLYLEATLARIDRWHGRAIAAVAAAGDRPEATDRVLDELRHEGASSDEIALVAEAAGEVKRLDSLFRPYLPSHVASGLRDEPSVGRLGGVEREVSVMFADLAGFTTFSETRSPSVVIAMLNRYWADVVPVDRRVGRGHRAVRRGRGHGQLQHHRRDGRPCPPSCQGRTRDRRGGAPSCRRAPGLAAVPGGRQHRNRGGRHRRFDRAPQFRGHRRHDEHRGATPRGRRAGTGRHRAVDVDGTGRGAATASRWDRRA